MAEPSPAQNAGGDHHADTTAKQPWEPMRLTYLGNAAELLQSSTGKTSTPSFDTGDRQAKQRGQG
jgi:hypothetical protein